MEKILDATYDGEVFRPDEPVELASNTKVKIIIKDEEERPKKLNLVEMPKKGKSEPYAFLRYAKSLKLEGPSDFSKNLDEYLYGGKSLEDAE